MGLAALVMIAGVLLLLIVNVTKNIGALLIDNMKYLCKEKLHKKFYNRKKEKCK